MNELWDVYGESNYLSIQRKNQTSAQRQYDSYKEKEREEKKNENDIIRY